ncbi:major facilitator superfamily domain-containing protein [Xylariales sp. AK1849]|nr:major facilitator superfamily domain-containing protein [Xylariales sp. AK1849]
MESDDESPGFVRQVLEELGLVSVYESSMDVKFLCLQRFVRLFAYGASTLILVAYLEALDISKTQIGLFMTLTLAGDTCISFFLTLFADALGRKAVLVLGAALMTVSGIIFAISGNYWILLLAAIIGVISPSGSEIGPFRAIEESIIAHLTAPEIRGQVYAWYSLAGWAGTAFGMLTGGWVIHHLTKVLKWDKVQSYRVIFYVYAGLGVLKMVLALLLSHKVESEKKQEQTHSRTETGETTSLLNDEAPHADGPKPESKKGSHSLLPNISKESIAVVINLCFLFALDSFASGLAPISWLTFFFHTRYNVEEGTLGTIFLVTSLVTAASMLVGASLAKRFGNVNTMVFTHLPSSIFLAVMPLPNEVHWSLLFLVLRACTQSMDTPPRSAFLAMIILPGERTAVMGTLNVIRTTSQALGPLITGILADRHNLWVSFVIAGGLKSCYDLGLLAMFKNKEKAMERAQQERVEGDGASNADGDPT